jgi:hypothetical protein
MWISKPLRFFAEQACSFAGFGPLSSSSIVLLIGSLCGRWSSLIPDNSFFQAPAGPLNCEALFKDCMVTNCMYEVLILGVLFPCKNTLEILK